jgi:hypothetical protein
VDPGGRDTRCRKLHNDELYNKYFIMYHYRYKNSEIRGPCNTHARNENCLQSFSKNNDGQSMKYLRLCGR